MKTYKILLKNPDNFQPAKKQDTTASSSQKTLAKNTDNVRLHSKPGIL